MTAITHEPPDHAEPFPRELAAISAYNDLVAQSARSPRVLGRLVRAAGVPLTRATLDVLVVISRHRSITVSSLARRLDVDQSTVSRQIRPLEHHGLISRTEGPADRRVASLAVTSAGRAALDRVQRVVHRDLEAALASWSSADRQQLGELLDRFRRCLLELPVA
jgi:DNA-binding MarR family transcriptional regulator